MRSRACRICFVSLVSRDDSPLYIQAFDLPKNVTGEDTVNANRFLKYNFLSHMALDIFASPMSLSLHEQQLQEQRLAELDLGGATLLFVQDDVTVYGNETSTGLKIIVGTTTETVEDEGETVKKQSFSDLFSRILRCYLRIVCNPFSCIDQNDAASVLQGPKFDNSIREIVEQWNGPAGTAGAAGAVGDGEVPKD